MCADNHSTPEASEIKAPSEKRFEHEFSQNVGEQLRTALKAYGYWPSEVMWTPESVRPWVVEEMEQLNPLHLQVVMQVVTGLRVLELGEEEEYVQGVLDELGLSGEEEE